MCFIQHPKTAIQQISEKQATQCAGQLEQLWSSSAEECRNKVKEAMTGRVTRVEVPTVKLADILQLILFANIQKKIFLHLISISQLETHIHNTCLLKY